MSKGNKPAPVVAPVTTEAPEPGRHSTTLPPAPPKPVVVRHIVAKGRSVTSERGILDQGTEVKASDFGAAGEESLTTLVAKGIVIEVSE